MIWAKHTMNEKTPDKKCKEYCSDILYAVSIKEDTAYLCMHFTRNHKGLKSYTSYPEDHYTSLIGGDKEWTMALQEATDFATTSELRRLFVHILIFCNVSSPINLWQKPWQNLCDDVPRKLSKSLRISQIERDAKKMQASILFDIQVMLNSYSKSLEDFGLPTPPQDMLPILQNRLLMEETNYNPEVLLKENNLLIPRLNKEQKLIFNEIITAVQDNVQKLIFIYGHGGTGKTFLWKAITTALRSEEKIVLTVASSGIASLLLPSSRTTHSRFQLSLNLKDESTCHIKKNSQLTDLLRRTNLIIWDEAPMNDRHCFEALDRCLRDILDSPHTFFWGLQHYVRRICALPIKSDGSSKTMPIPVSTWLLDIGNGNIGTPDESETKDIFNVHIPTQLCISDSDIALTELINFIYDDIALQTPTVEDLQKKAIVAPINERADMINAHVLSLVNHQQRIYLSSDEAIPHGNDGAGLCNETRLIVTQLLDKVIEARIITGTRTSEKVFLPRISLINRDLQLPFIFKRKQFPVKLCYAMTINKSQGQSLQRIGIFLPEPVFTHGQFKMIEPSNPSLNQIDKGKLPLVEVTTVSKADIKPAQVDQAIEDFAFYVYTLPNDITLIFGRYTSFIPIPNDNFPEHYFNFIACNEVDARADVSGAPLTAESFDINAYEKMPKPVIIAVSLTWATKRYGALQINATSATYYYSNPEFPETSHILNVTRSTNSPAAKILEGSSTATDPPSTTEGHLPTATAKDNVTEATKDLEKKASATCSFPRTPATRQETKARCLRNKTTYFGP
uniref:ATP-dependent DNA helicase n=1 Tax=Tanacetum cinerariifolium TaxID=118510 RepID=A0A6L2M167_TANCI|nr:DNA helicase [Tanacetum cinerariifolium]